MRQNSFDMLQAKMTFKFRKKKTLTELVDTITRIALKGKYGQIYTSDYIYDEALPLALIRTNNIAVAMDIAEVIQSPRIK
jgi:predicted nucleic acid-binding protein